VRYEYRKNPNYWVPNRPFLDGFDRPVIGEYAQQLAQFRAGRLWGGVVRQEDVIATKQEIPELEVYQGEFTRGNWKIFFSLRPDSPFRDARVRRAISMLIDRDLIIETFSDTKRFEDAGWPVETRWHSIGISAGYDGIWLDPRTNALGEGAANFEYNPAEAARLMAAAGVPKPLPVPLQFIQTSQYGTVFPRVGEAYKGILDQSGLFRIEQRNPDYATEYLPNVYFGKGDFDGIAWGATTIFPVPVQHLVDYYTSTGARQKVAFGGDPTTVEGQVEAEAIVNKAIRSLDYEETVSLLQEWQRHESLRMPDVPSPWPYGTAGFGLSWPWVKNVGTYRDYLENPEMLVTPNWWIDESLRKT
jgi:ABC-type transport system substrate-binding protein